MSYCEKEGAGTLGKEGMLAMEEMSSSDPVAAEGERKLPMGQ